MNGKNIVKITVTTIVDRIGLVTSILFLSNKVIILYTNTTGQAGTAIVGNMGSEMRLDYSVIGDPVNLAARLESASKTLGRTLIVSENTKKGIEHKFTFEYIDEIIVKGKTEPVKVYSLER